MRGWDDPRMPTISRPAPARVPGRGHARVRRDDRGRQGGQRRRGRPARARRPRRAQPDGPAAVRRARPAEGGHRELPRGPGRGDGGRQQPGGPVRRDAARWRSGASCGSSATTSWRSPRPSSSAWPRVARCGCGARTSSPAPPWSRTPRATWWSCAAPTTRRLAAGTRRTGGGRRRRSTGSRPRTPCRPRSGCTTTCSPDRIPGADGDLFADLNPDSETVVTGAFVEPSLAEAAVGETVQFERLGYFCADPDSRAGGARVQPDADAQGHLGEGAGPGVAGPARRASISWGV